MDLISLLFAFSLGFQLFPTLARPAMYRSQSRNICIVSSSLFLDCLDLNQRCCRSRGDGQTAPGAESQDGRPQQDHSAVCGSGQDTAGRRQPCSRRGQANVQHILYAAKPQFIHGVSQYNHTHRIINKNKIHLACFSSSPKKSKMK